MSWARQCSILACALALGCSNDDDGGPKDCKLVAAFDLTLRTASGPLPADTALEVTYGGGSELFSVEQGVQGQEVVLCDDTRDAGASDGGVTKVHCKLWTQGATTVKVTATGYEPVERALEAEAEGKCIQTVPVEIVLGDPDGGT